MLDLAFLIPALPLAGFCLLLLTGKKLGDPKAGWIATATVSASFIVSVLVFFALLGRDGEERHFTQNLFEWIHIGSLEVDVSLLVDPLSMTMALFVTGVASLIHLYSVGYMKGEARYDRFFLYLNLFVFFMLMLVLADSLPLMFLGWEGVGACSYFLISFWFERDRAASAGKKAFVVNRVGDVGFLVAMFLIFSALGTLNLVEVLDRAGELATVTATAVGLLLFLGACGKSAQLPLYVWLPDAMEGPTPVSALIHAATMVTAGVYLMTRVAPILDHADVALNVIAIVGVATAFFAATIACAQNDIKRVLAYSTISQLGYMFLAVGSGAYVAAVFHMVTHAFFKALLFLGSGSVIHGLHEEQDMKHMGGLRKLMPITGFTFIVGWLAIAGVPPFSGFWSKDEVLLAAYAKSPVLWAIGVVTALLTAYYMTRQVLLVFYGGERWNQSGNERAPHESSPTMWIPLVVLAVLAVVAGLINLPFKPVRLALEHWLHPVVGEFLIHTELSGGFQVLLGALATVGVLAGLVMGWSAWREKTEQPRLEPGFLRRAWGIDSTYAAVIATPGKALAAWTAYVFDRRVIDGAVNGIGAVVQAGGQQVRQLQTGFVRNYALGVLAGAALLLAFVLLRASV